MHIYYGQWLPDESLSHPPTDEGKWQHSGPWLFAEEIAKEPRSANIATYRFDLPALAPGHYQIELPIVTHAYEAILLSPEAPSHPLRVKVGTPSLDPGQSIRHMRSQIIDFQVKPDAETWRLLLRVSFHGVSSGGLWSLPKLSPGEQLAFSRNNYFKLVYACLGGNLVLLVYMLMIYLRRREDHSALYLVGLCCGICLRTIGVERLPGEWFETVGSSTLNDLSMRFEYASISLITVCFLLFIVSCFSEERHYPKRIKVFSILTLILFVAHFIGSFTIIYDLIGISQAALVLVTLYSLRTMASAIYHRQSGAVYALCSSLAPLGISLFEIYHSRSGGSLRFGHFAGTLFIFMQSQVLAKRFAQAFRQADHLNHNLQDEVKKQTQQIRSLMDNFPEGLCSINSKGFVALPYAQHLETIFPRSMIAQKTFRELILENFVLSLEQGDVLQSVLSSTLGEDELNWQFNSDMLPKTACHSSGRTYDLSWYPVVIDQKVEEIICFIRDVTDLRQLEDEHRHKAKEDLKVVELINAQHARLEDFFVRSLALVKETIQILTKPQLQANDVRYVFSLLHTLKGNAKQVQLKQLASLVHQVEAPYTQAHNKLAQSQPNETDLGALNGLFQEIQEYFRLYQKIFQQRDSSSLDVLFTESEVKQISDWIEQPEVHTEAIRKILKKRLHLSLADELQNLEQSFADIARQLGKPPPQIIPQLPAELDLPKTVRGAVLDILGHLMRNSLDHGIEPPHVREQRGKKQRGQIYIKAEVNHKTLRMKVWDDGQGIDLKKVAERARATGKFESSTELPDFAEAIHLLCSPGFSTKEEVTEISGRGIGLDAVKTLVSKVSGQIEFVPMTPQAPNQTDSIPFVSCLEIPLDAA